MLLLATSGIFLSKADEINGSEIPAEIGGETYAPAGRMVFIPDSLLGDVERVLNGYSKIVRDDSKIDPGERVIVNGDTIPLIIRERNMGRFDRGLFNFLFIPKGVWQLGLTASYGEIGLDDMQMGDLLANLDLSGHTFSIKPYLSYFVRSNLSVGFRLGYTKSQATLGQLKMDIEEDMNLNIQNVSYDDESYTAAVNLRQYIGLGRGSRFGVFNEAELSFSSGNSYFRRPFAGEPKVTRTTYMDARITFSPGVCVMVMKNVSFNLSFGIFGFHLRNSKQTVDGEEMGSRVTSGANFRLNIFNLNFGLGVHI